MHSAKLNRVVNHLHVAGQSAAGPTDHQLLLAYRTRGDHTAFAEYHRQTRTPEGFAAWLDEWVYGLADRAAYLAHLGAERWAGLAIQRSLPAAPVDFGY